LTPDWRELLCALIDHRVKFLVVGGIALAAHAEPRFTKDLDVLVEATVANSRRLHAALVDFGFGAVAPDASELAKAGRGWLLGRTPKSHRHSDRDRRRRIPERVGAARSREARWPAEGPRDRPTRLAQGEARRRSTAGSRRRGGDPGVHCR
jgi:hypothetical protein